MFAWILRLIVLLLIIRIVWSFLRGLSRGLGSPRRKGAPVAGVRLVRDPVCGTFVDPTRALAAPAHGATYYFCSDRCQRAFAKQGTAQGA